jgi:hypothetical protein
MEDGTRGERQASGAGRAVKTSAPPSLGAVMEEERPPQLVNHDAEKHSVPIGVGPPVFQLTRSNS